MKPFPLAVLMAGVLVTTLPQLGLGQSYTCLPDTTHMLYYDVVRLVTGTDSATVAKRSRYDLPAVAKSKVTVVTTQSICNQAGAAYHAAVTPSGTPPVSRTLVVIKVGNSRFVVTDPNQHAGEFDITDVFDSQWNRLAGWLS